MRDKFVFSDGQDLSACDSTGKISTNWYDLEYDDSDVLIKTAMMVECWLHIHILTCTQTLANEGWIARLIESASTNGSSPRYLGGIILLEAEMVAGNHYCIGVSKQCTLRYLSVWYAAFSTAVADGVFTVDAWIDDSPSTSPTYRCQKRPA